MVHKWLNKLTVSRVMGTPTRWGGGWGAGGGFGHHAAVLYAFVYVSSFLS